ncbi:MAG: M23 family peptidase, partial [Proteobacteria bacterium]
MDRMEKRTVTFMMASNRKGTTKKIVLSAAWLKAGLTLAIVLTVIASACVVDYVGLLSESIENKRLRVENAQLKQKFQVVEGKLNALETGLERVKGFVTKLRLITSVESEDRSLKLAIGPMPRTGQSVESETLPSGRTPASAAAAVMPHDDSIFAEKPPAD